MKLDGVEITWLGHAAFRFRLDDGATLLIDPFLAGNPLCPAEAKRPGQVDAIFVTHGHRDHLGDAATIALSTGATVFSIFEIKRWLMQQGLEDEQTVPLNKGGTVSAPGGVRATFVHAVHSSGIYGEDGMIDGGSAGGWVLDFPGGTHRLPRRRHGCLRGYEVDRRALGTGHRLLADRWPFHHGPPFGSQGGRPTGSGGGYSDALRDLSRSSRSTRPPAPTRRWGFPGTGIQGRCPGDLTYLEVRNLAALSPLLAGRWLRG